MWWGTGRREVGDIYAWEADHMSWMSETGRSGGGGWGSQLMTHMSVTKARKKKRSWDDSDHATCMHTQVCKRPLKNQATNAPIHAHTLTLLFFPPHLSGLQAINSWNWALANSFIQSLVERQNAHGLWCTLRTGRYWKWWMVAKTTLSTTLPNTAPCVFDLNSSQTSLLF